MSGRLTQLSESIWPHNVEILIQVEGSDHPSPQYHCGGVRARIAEINRCVRKPKVMVENFVPVRVCRLLAY